MKLPKNFQFGFQQKWVLITGGGKGTDRQITAMLYGFNARVVALSRTKSDLQNLKEEINCETIIAELSEPDAIRQVTEQTGEIDSLVNNAAIAILEPFLKITVEAWDKTMAVNLRSVMIISQVIAKQMIERGITDSIVNVSSMAAFQALHDHAAYCTRRVSIS